MKLAGKTLLITGGAGGIGLELAKQMMARGATVVVTGRKQANIDEAVRDAPGLTGLVSDVADPEAITALHAEMGARFPALDGLVNNAGVMRNLDLNAERSLTDVTREIEVNLMGPVRMVQQFLPHLKTRPEALILNVSSGLAFVPMPASPVYCATKAGMHSFSQSLRVQLRDTRVTVVELAPPGTETKLFRGEFEQETKGVKAMDPRELVSRTLAGIEAGKLEIRPGQSNMLKTLSRLAPDFALKQMTRMTSPH